MTLPISALAWGALALVVGLVVWAILDLFVFRSAQIRTSVAGLPVRVRCASWLNILTRADATVVRDVIHLKRGVHKPSLRFLAAEYYHVYQWSEFGVFGFLWKFLTNRGWIEVMAHGAMGPMYERHPHIAHLQRLITSRYDGTLRRA